MHLYTPFGFGGLGWGWGWAATAGSIIVLGILLVPMFFFLLNLHNLLERVDARNRAMAPANVWLNFIPVFNLYWLMHTVMKVRDSVKAEYASRGWAPDGDFGYSVGMTAAVLVITSFFFGWIPFIGWLMSVALLICWILYWLKTSEVKGRLAQQGTWRPAGPQGYPGGPQGYSAAGPPFVPPVTPPYTAQQPTTQQFQQPTPSAGSFTPPVARGAKPETGQPGGAQPGAVAGAPAETRRGGACAACGTAYSPTDGFCRTCGLRLP
jgi:hypothetical protein